jgi:hypothetical protein
MKLVHGSLYLQGKHVDALIDDDNHEIMVSDEVPIPDRLDLAAAAKRMASAHPSGPGVHFADVSTSPHPASRARS